MFTKDDLKPGMAVELRNGDYCLLVPLKGDYAVAYINGDRLQCSTVLQRLNDDLTHKADKNFDVVKVYDLSDGCGRLFGNGERTGRDLLWERVPPKEMTLSQIEEALGYPVKIVKEEK